MGEFLNRIEMENTLEDKAKFFAIYWGQRVMRCKTFNVTTGHGLSGLMNVDVNSETIKENWFLELKTLSSISDEDALEVANLLGNSSNLSEYSKIYQAKDLIATNNFYTKQTNITANQWLKVFDFLRSRGYTLPWMGLSVDELIEYGWIKLKDK